ncbi:MAG: hypothetical protein M3R04_05395, partial [bacterium]|nr:hypothetical protein [bacterium]
WKSPLTISSYPIQIQARLRGDSELYFFDEYGFLFSKLDQGNGRILGSFAPSSGPSTHGVRTAYDELHGCEVHVFQARGARREYLMTCSLSSGLYCFDQQGNALWKMAAYGEGELTVGPDDSLYFTNQGLGEGVHKERSVLARLSPQGEVVWANEISSALSTRPMLDDKGNTYLFTGDIHINNETSLYKVSADGLPSWKYSFPKPEGVSSLTVCPTGEYCAFTTYHTDESGLLLVIDANGSVVGAKPLARWGEPYFAGAKRIYLTVPGETWKTPSHVVAFDLKQATSSNAFR